MLDPFIRKEIRDEVKRLMDVLLPAKTGVTTAQSEDIKELYPQMPTIETRPVMHPYGLSSRAPTDTRSIIGRVGEHTTARIILGHLDDERANINMNEGEVVLYNQYGQQIRLEENKINLGENADEPAVLGQQLMDLLSEILDKLIAGNLCLTTTAGNPTAANPAIATQLTQLKTKYITTATTNIVSQEVFLERKPT